MTRPQRKSSVERKRESTKHLTKTGSGEYQTILSVELGAELVVLTVTVPPEATNGKKPKVYQFGLDPGACQLLAGKMLTYAALIETAHQNQA